MPSSVVSKPLPNHSLNRTLAGGAGVPSTRGRLAWFVRRRKRSGTRGKCMDRRAFVRCSVGSLLCGPLVADAQTTPAVRRIAFLTVGARFTQKEIEEITGPLRQPGWVEGKNLAFEQRYAAKPELLQPLAEELVRQNVDLIITEGTPAAVAAKSATKTIPVVMRAAGDPVLAGLVASLARPGGNVTGYSLANPEQGLKRLALLRELLPGIQRVGELENPANHTTQARASTLKNPTDRSRWSQSSCKWRNRPYWKTRWRRWLGSADKRSMCQMTISLTRTPL